MPDKGIGVVVSGRTAGDISLLDRKTEELIRIAAYVAMRNPLHRRGEEWQGLAALHGLAAVACA